MFYLLNHIQVLIKLSMLFRKYEYLIIHAFDSFRNLTVIKQKLKLLCNENINTIKIKNLNQNKTRLDEASVFLISLIIMNKLRYPIRTRSKTIHRLQFIRVLNTPRRITTD